MLLWIFLAQAATAPETEGALSWARALTNLGALGVAGFFGWMLWRGHFVFKREIDAVVTQAARDRSDDELEKKELKSDRDEWKRMALQLMQRQDRIASASERAVGAAEQVVTQIAGPK